MKIKIFTLLIAVFLNSAVFSQNSSYEIATWKGFRTSAASFTFDDNCANQFSNAVPIFDSLGYKASFYPVISWSPNWSTLQTLVNNGHEVGSHSVNHGNPMPDSEISSSKNTIDQNISGQVCNTITYPNCNEPSETEVARYYIGGRICDGQVQGKTPSNYFRIGSIICGNQGSCNSLNNFKTQFGLAINRQGWVVFQVQEVDNGSGASPLASSIIENTLSYVKDNDSLIWLTTFRNAILYSKERNAATITELTNTATEITLSITDNLDNAIYNYPISIKRELPNGWTNVIVKQNDVVIESNIVGNYIYFDAVPDAGTCAISLTYFIPETATVCNNDLPYTWRGTDYGIAGVYYDSLQTATGCDSVYQLTLNVNPPAVVNPVASQIVCNGNNTTAVVFETTNSGGTMRYTWTNNNTSTGLAASGEGNIASFAAVNNGVSPVVATIVVTPYFTNNGVECTGATETFTITVNPAPVISTIEAPAAINSNESLTLTAPTVTDFGSTVTAQGWQLSETVDFATPTTYTGQTLAYTYDGWYLRYWATGGCGTSYSNSVNIRILTVTISGVDGAIVGSCITLTATTDAQAPTYQWYAGDSLLQGETSNVLTCSIYGTTEYKVRATETATIFIEATKTVAVDQSEILFDCNLLQNVRIRPNSYRLWHSNNGGYWSTEYENFASGNGSGSQTDYAFSLKPYFDDKTLGIHSSPCGNYTVTIEIEDPDGVRTTISSLTSFQRYEFNLGISTFFTHFPITLILLLQTHASKR